MDQNEAEESLRALQIVKGRLARRAQWTWQCHAAFGAVMGTMVASYALPHPIIVLGFCLLAVCVIVAADRQRDGFFVNGYRPGSTRRITAYLLIVSILALVAGIYGRNHGWPSAPLFSGLLLACVATWASKAWEHVYQAELEGL